MDAQGVTGISILGAIAKAQMERPRTMRQIARLQAEGAAFVDAVFDMASVKFRQPPDTHRSTFCADLDDD